MTNGWIDIKNTDLMLIMGGNPAENHPCGFKWPIEAKLHRNAKIIVVDPRFTRTAASADLFLQIRAGSDIAFLGGLINFAIQNNRLAHDYLVHYTNASFVVKDGFRTYRFKAAPAVEVRAPRAERAKVLEEHVARFATLLAETLARHPYQWFNFYGFWA